MNATTVRIIGAVGALWNLGGVYAYLSHVGMLGAAAAPSAGGAAMPAAITAAFAISAFAGSIGAIGLALVMRWARSVLWTAFVAAMVNWGWVFAYGRADEVPLGVTVLLVLLALALVAQRHFRSAAGGR